MVITKVIKRARLRRVLKKIYNIDPSRSGNWFSDNQEQMYDLRNVLVKKAVVLAIDAGYKAGYVMHSPLEDLISGVWEPEWSVVAIIELPTGQVSWHLDSRGLKYDGHRDCQKWGRVIEYIGGGE